jgi:N-acetylglucosaminyldiphosphoundecaprenol N-acetyl-beta-D-mannosaminyltransferase
VPRLIERAALKGYRIFFLGGRDEVAEKAVTQLSTRYPSLKVVGHFSPPFAPLHQMPHDEIRKRIQAAKPDLLFVSFGCPKAEKWMAMHYKSLGVPVLIGVGATIDFLAGNLKRAPGWMQRGGIEWVYRLLQEPRRLAGRYGNDLWRFGLAMSQQWWNLQPYARRARRTPPGSTVLVEPTWERVRVPDRFDRDALRRAPEIWEQKGLRHCLIELSNVKFIDSTAIAFLVRLQRKLRPNGWQLVLLEPSAAVRRALKLMHLEKMFLIATDILEARQAIQEQGAQLESRPAWFFRSPAGETATVSA